MIIDNKYDMALWLIFSKDIENRELIIKFLEKMPKELIEKLQVSLKEGKKEVSEEEVVTVQISDKHSYWYSVDGHTGILEMGRMFSLKTEKVECFHLILYPTSKAELDSMKCGESKPIGLVYNYFVEEKPHKKRRTFDFQLYSFNMYKNLLGGLYMKSSNLLDHKNSLYPSSMSNKNFDGLSIGDFVDRKTLKRAVKKRKK